MLNRIIDWAVVNRLLVVLALLGVGAGAVALLPRLNLDAFPDVTNVQVTVNAEAPGLAAEEVEQLITFPIEAVMYSLPDVDEVRSISATGLAVITVVFEEGTDIYFARQLVFERLQEAREQIPEGVGIPEMGPNTSGLGQVFKYYLRAEDPSRYDAMTLRSLNDWVIKLLLMPVEGVTSSCRSAARSANTRYGSIRSAFSRNSSRRRTSPRSFRRTTATPADGTWTAGRNNW